MCFLQSTSHCEFSNFSLYAYVDAGCPLPCTPYKLYRDIDQMQKTLIANDPAEWSSLIIVA